MLLGQEAMLANGFHLSLVLVPTRTKTDELWVPMAEFSCFFFIWIESALAALPRWHYNRSQQYHHRHQSRLDGVLRW
jgi:hypothetical protein